MSEISRELQEQMGSVPEVMRKLFPDGPKISEEEANKLREEEKQRLEVTLAQERIKALEAKLNDR